MHKRERVQVHGIVNGAMKFSCNILKLTIHTTCTPNIGHASLHHRRIIGIIDALKSVVQREPRAHGIPDGRSKTLEENRGATALAFESESNSFDRAALRRS